VNSWLDIPLLVHCGAVDGDGDDHDRTIVIGKMTIDSVVSHADLDPCDVGLWALAERAASYVHRPYECLPFPGRVKDLFKVEEFRNKVYREAIVLAVLDDQLRTILAELRGDPAFGARIDRLRLYLTIAKTYELFGSYIRTVLRDPPSRKLKGFWARTHVGHVRDQFEDIITSAEVPSLLCLEECDEEVYERYRYREIHERLSQGDPVVFTSVEKRHSLAVRPCICYAPRFSHAQSLDRESLKEHLDLPIIGPSSKTVIGKISMDSSSRATGDMPKFTKGQISELKMYARKVGARIEEAKTITDDEELFEAISRHMRIRPHEFSK